MTDEEMVSKYERVLEEERQRTTAMTLANDDIQRELHTLQDQRDDMLVALRVAHFALLNRGKGQGSPDEQAVWSAAAAVAQEGVEKAIEAGEK